MLKCFAWCCCGHGRKQTRSSGDKQLHRSTVTTNSKEQNDNSVKTAVEGADTSNSNTNGASTLNEIVFHQGGSVPGVVVNLHPLSPSNQNATDDRFESLYKVMHQIAEIQNFQVRQTDRLISCLHDSNLRPSTAGRTTPAGNENTTMMTPPSFGFDGVDMELPHNNRRRISTFQNNDDTPMSQSHLSPLRIMSPRSPQFRYNSSNARGRKSAPCSPSSMISSSIQQRK